MIRLALLDMNNNHPNQGMGNIVEIAAAFKAHSQEDVYFQKFDVRYKNEIPAIEDFDIFISSGGPGNPHSEGLEWEKPFYQFIDGIWNYNKQNIDKKYLFLICHSFQVACVHWDIAEVTERHSYSFGVMPIHKTAAGRKDSLLKNLPDPFYSVDSRAYQVIQPKTEKLEQKGMEVICLEKIRPYVPYERAVMAIRFSKEIVGTQFHPEANPEGFLRALKVDQYRNAIISEHGIDKYQETIDRIDDEDKVVLTRREVLPGFLAFASSELTREMACVG